MDRRLLFPAVAATVWAQQGTPAAAEADKTLRERVQQFYQLQQDQKYRQAEAMVADDTKDDYYASKKPRIQAFTIEKIELSDDLKTAKVLIKAKIEAIMPGAGAQLFDFPTPTTWKVEGGEWRWYISEEAKVATPFGKISKSDTGGGNPSTKGQAPGAIDNPDVSALQGQILVDRMSVELSADKRQQIVTITNNLPGPLDLQIDPHAQNIPGLTVKAAKTHLEAGQKGTIEFQLEGNKRIADVVEIVAQPLNRVFAIQVVSK